MTNHVRHATKRRPTLVGRAVLLLPFLLMPLMGPSTVALSAVEEHVLGQVIRTEIAEINGERVAIVLSYERNVADGDDEETPHRSEIIVAPESDPSTWRRLGIRGSTTLLSIADVDADGQDDVIVVHPSGGSLCPASLVGQVPCGIIRVFDGPSLMTGQPLLIAQINVRPTSDACVPSAYTPSSLVVRDLDGDERAELAFGQLAMYPGTCGVVHVFPGSTLSGEVTMEKSCARIVGPVYSEGAPDQFGLSVELFNGGSPTKPMLAVAAPYMTGEKPVNGRVTVHELPSSCVGGPAVVPAGTLPKSFEYWGEAKASVAGIDLALHEHQLLIGANAQVDVLDVASFSIIRTHRPANPYPIALPGDVNGDGEEELMFGPWLVSQDGDMLLYMGPCARDSFRGSFLTPDSIIGADRFGLELWSITDVWNPRLVIGASLPRVDAGEVVNVSVRERINLVPTDAPVSFAALGGQIVETGSDWIHVRAGGAKELLVTGSLLSASHAIRIPIDPIDTHVAFEGPTVVPLDQPFIGRVYAPAGSVITWRAASGTPSLGEGAVINTKFPQSGTTRIDASVRLPNGQTKALEHTLTVLAPPPSPLQIAAPTSIPQGDELVLRVLSPRSDAAYTWMLQSTQFGLSEFTGTEMRMPTAGWGPVHVTLAEAVGSETTRVANARVFIQDMQPIIRALEVKTVDGIDATIDAYDPGADPLMIEWSVDGVPSAVGSKLQLPRSPGPVTLGVKVTDDGGLSVGLERSLNITSSWVVKENGPTTEPTAEPGAIDAVPQTGDLPASESPGEYRWKQVDRIKGQQEAGAANGQGIPATDAMVLALVLVAAAFAKRRPR